MGHLSGFCLEALARPYLSLYVFGLVAQASLEHGFLIVFLSLFQDLLSAPSPKKIDVGGHQFAEALFVLAKRSRSGVNISGAAPVAATLPLTDRDNPVESQLTAILTGVKGGTLTEDSASRLAG
ncbi:MAG: hypothetical protein P8X51_06055 [Maritimibacter sp.]